MPRGKAALVRYTDTMTSRYALYETAKLRDRFNLADGVPKGIKPHYNISPIYAVPVVVARDGKNSLELMKWGFLPKNATDANSVFRYKTFNARTDGIFSKPIWQGAIRTARCLIPANGFYEWKTTADGKRPFYIQPLDQPLFAFAGIYGSWTDADGKEWQTCAIITAPSGSGSDMVPRRLPVIVHPEDEAAWLNEDATDVTTLYRIMRPYDAEQLTFTTVGDGINSTKIDTSELIKGV